MNHQITLYRRTDGCFFIEGWGGVQICNKGLRRYVSLPRGIEQIFLCFTKRARADSFEIEPRFEGCYRGRLIEYPRVGLMCGFSNQLGKQFKNGHKFFHFEY